MSYVDRVDLSMRFCLSLNSPGLSVLTCKPSTITTTLQECGVLFRLMHNTLATVLASLFFGEVCDFSVNILAVTLGYEYAL